MLSTFSPRKTRSQRRKKDDLPPKRQTNTSDPSITFTSSHQGDGRAVEVLPSQLTCKMVGLEKHDMQLLLRKQDWLKFYKILPTTEAKTTQRQIVVNATLAFRQKGAGTTICTSPDRLLLTCSHCVAESSDHVDLDQKHALIFASSQVIQARCIA
jgi:hypothetical protein